MDKELVQNAARNFFQNAVIEDWADPDQHRIATKPRFNTACWSWGFGSKTHNIYIGLAIAESIVAANEEYIAAYVAHEMSHAKHTERDLKKLSQWCKDNKVPFQLINLLEDARIEHLWRVETGKKFNWLKHEKLSVNDKPQSLLFAIIQSENAAPKEAKSAEKYDRVLDYYNRAIACADTWAVAKLALEWLEEFGEEGMQPPSGQGGKGEPGAAGEGSGSAAGEGSGGDEKSGPRARYRDMEATLEAMAAGELEEISEGDDCLVQLEQPEEHEDRDPLDEGNFGHWLSQDIEYRGYCVLNGRPHRNSEYSIKEARDLCRSLRLPTIAPKTPVSSIVPSRRLSARNLARGVDAIYRHKEASKGVHKINMNVYVDLSGSMSGAPIRNAKTILLALSYMASKKQIEGKVYFHKEAGLSIATLPVNFDILDRAIANGGTEGIANAFNETISEAAKADVNLCLTDGQITDSPIDVDRLRRRGVFTIGAYVGELDLDRMEFMGRWFDKSLTRPSVAELGNEINRVMKVAKLKKKSGNRRR